MELVMSSDDGRISRRSWTNLAFVSLTLAVASLAMACSDPGNQQSTSSSGQGGSTASSSGSTSSGGGAGGEGGGGGSGVEMPGPVEEVMQFNKVMGELPEGLAIDGTTAYVAFGSTFVIKIDLVTKMRSDFGNIPAPIGVGMPQGMAIDPQKNLYIGAASADQQQFKPGIYKFPMGGGAATLFAEDASLSYPRHIAFHSSGTMVVAVPPGARMLTVTKTGQVNDPGVAQVLSGDQGSSCAFGNNIPYGVTSVALDGDNLVATVADRGQLINGGMAQDMSGNLYAVPAMMDAVFAGPDCATLGGAESIVIDNMDPNASTFNKTTYVAARRVDKITKVTEFGDVTVIADKTNLYEPSAMAMAVIDGDRYLYIVNSAATTFATTGIPGLVRIRLGKAK